LSAGSAKDITAFEEWQMAKITEIAAALREAAIDGWLFYDFRMSDPLAYRILGIPEKGITSRRWFFFIPAAGEPCAIVSAVEAHRLDTDTLSASRRIVYRSEREMIDALANLLKGQRRIAMNYSPECAIPYVSRVDAGTVELVRSMGVEIVTAADLIQRFEAVLTTAQLAGHRRAAAALRDIVNETFAEISRRVRGHLPCTEFTMQNFVLGRIAAHNLHTDEAPLVATNANAANPHFEPSAEKDTPIHRGDLVLLDLFAKERDADSIYGDLTWMGSVGEGVEDEHARVFHLVAGARDAAVALIRSRVNEGWPVSGAEADRAARAVIEDAGFGDQFVHRTGHSIGREVHGTGCNLDSLETRDYRMLIDHTCFSVEPGIYLPGQFGVRSELDMTIEDGRAEISGGFPQHEIIPILTRHP
jgi:Xaa-Pro dipeptidase